MTIRDLMRALAWLTRDTFRQAAETRILAMMLGLSGLAILFCLSVGINEGPPSPSRASARISSPGPPRPRSGPGPLATGSRSRRGS